MSETLGRHDPYATVETISAFLGIPITTLRLWKDAGIGPPAAKAGDHLRYRWEDVEAWIEWRAQIRESS